MPWWRIGFGDARGQDTRIDRGAVSIERSFRRGGGIRHVVQAATSDSRCAPPPDDSQQLAPLPCPIRRRRGVGQQLATAADRVDQGRVRIGQVTKQPMVAQNRVSRRRVLA